MHEEKSVRELLLNRNHHLVQKLSELLRQIVTSKDTLEGVSFSVVVSSETEDEVEEEPE
jgi:hypothetical protein